MLSNSSNNIVHVWHSNDVSYNMSVRSCSRRQRNVSITCMPTVNTVEHNMTTLGSCWTAHKVPETVNCMTATENG